MAQNSRKNMWSFPGSIFAWGRCFVVWLLCSIGLVVHAEPRNTLIWQDADVASERPGTHAKPLVWIEPESFRLVKLRISALSESTALSSGSESSLITLPMPNGEQETFIYWEVETMEPGLRDWFLQQGFDMRTFAGHSVNNTSKLLRMDWGGPQGWHVSVVGPEGSFNIDPYWKDSTEYYAVYSRADQDRGSAASWSCRSADHDHSYSHRRDSDFSPTTDLREGITTSARTAGVLRAYRLANAATGEYTQFHGGSVADGQAAIVTAINRVNQVFERDLSIRLILISENSQVVYTNAGSDPYTNDDGFAMLFENQANLDAVFTSGGYDIGHVFSTGGGGIAALGSPCSSDFKAQGVTGLPAPAGDTFFIDFVAHELGHQFGAQHTWNSASCDINQRSANTAYEPGSGTTVMGYAGICGPADNLQLNSDAYFHYASINEILNFSQNGNDGDCDTPINPGGNPNEPTVDAGDNVTIPANTPFELTAVNGMDVDADATLTYLWEQYDLGPPTSITAGDTGQGPIIRSSLPTFSPTRSIPPVADVLDGSNSSSRPGEILPTTMRDLTFRVSVLDNDPEGGRVGTDTRTISVTTTGSGQFAVTAPNGGENLNNSVNVTWNVASTNLAPVGAANVDIFYSTDGGVSFALLETTVNDGNHVVNFPGGNTTQGRIKIRGSNNIFYDISDADFTVNSANPPSVSINDATVTEGDAATTNLAFTATLSAATAGATTVTYSTADGTAKAADNDYQPAASQTVMIAGGATTATINVVVNGDIAVEANEFLNVVLEAADNGVTVGAPSTGTGTITNDDMADSVSIGSASVIEGNSGQTVLAFPVILSAAQAGTTNVMYDTGDGSATAANNDYDAVTGGNLAIPAGSTAGSIDILVNGDTAEENSETLSVTLVGADAGVVIGNQRSGIGTIRDDDTVGAGGGGGAAGDPDAAVDNDGPGFRSGGGGGAAYLLPWIMLMLLPFRLLFPSRQD